MLSHAPYLAFVGLTCDDGEEFLSCVGKKVWKSGRLFTHSALLDTLGHHDNVVNILFPRHFPEVILSARKRSLSSNVFSSEVVPLR